MCPNLNKKQNKLFFPECYYWNSDRTPELLNGGQGVRYWEGRRHGYILPLEEIVENRPSKDQGRK